MGLYSEDICYDIFIANKSLHFFWNVFNTKAIKVCYIITIYVESYSVRSYWFILIKIYYTGPILYSVC